MLRDERAKQMCPQRFCCCRPTRTCYGTEAISVDLYSAQVLVHNAKYAFALIKDENTHVKKHTTQQEKERRVSMPALLCPLNNIHTGICTYKNYIGSSPFSLAPPACVLSNSWVPLQSFDVGACTCGMERHILLSMTHSALLKPPRTHTTTPHKRQTRTPSHTHKVTTHALTRETHLFHPIREQPLPKSSHHLSRWCCQFFRLRNLCRPAQREESL